MQSNKLNSFFAFLKKHTGWSLFGAIFIISILWMARTETLSYPYIMLSRQVQSISNCTFGSTDFKTTNYGFSFSVPNEFCILPNRLFPLDGSIEIVPKGWYFVINEYAKGTIAKASKATLLFEPILPDRNPDIIINTLVAGKFLKMSQVSSVTTASGMKVTLADSALGTDDALYDWAFYTHPNNKYFVAIVSKHSTEKTMLNYLINNLSTF